MPQPADTFALSSVLRFVLIVRLLGPIALLGITLWAISHPGIELSGTGPLVLLGLVVWIVFSAMKLAKWYGFTVGVGQDGLTVRDRTWRWDEIASARAKTAFQLDTFLELETNDGTRIEIPAAIQKNAFLLTMIEKHFPALVREA